MDSDTVGDVMHDSKVRALKTLALFASILVYAGMLAYTAVHNYTLILRGLPPDMVVWAILGVVTLEISALALPIALHFWTHDALQRFAAFAFYLLDLGLLWGNVVIDFALVGGGYADLPQWAHLYFSYVVPATPLIAGGGWSLIWLLDPASKHLAMLESLRASTRAALAQRVATAARGIDVDRMVTLAGADLARQVVGSTLGVTVQRTEDGHVPAGEVVVPASLLSVAPSSNGRSRSKAARPNG